MFQSFTCFVRKDNQKEEIYNEHSSGAGKRISTQNDKYVHKNENKIILSSHVMINQQICTCIANNKDIKQHDS